MMYAHVNLCLMLDAGLFKELHALRGYFGPLYEAKK